MAATDDGQRCFRWSEDLDLFGEWCAAGYISGDVFGKPFVARANDQSGEAAIGREQAALADLDFLFEKCFPVPADNGLHDGMIGIVRLDQAATAGKGATRAARDLMQELECALAGARVGALGQAQVAIDNTDDHPNPDNPALPAPNELYTNPNPNRPRPPTEIPGNTMF